jgi:hypothetical protein
MFVVDESGDPGLRPVAAKVDEDIARPQIEVDESGLGDFVEGVPALGHQRSHVGRRHAQRGLPAVGVARSASTIAVNAVRQSEAESPDSPAG